LKQLACSLLVVAVLVELVLAEAAVRVVTNM
jgi:hypothetical protein